MSSSCLFEFEQTHRFHLFNAACGLNRCNASLPDEIELLLAPVWEALGPATADVAGPEVALERRLAALEESVDALDPEEEVDPDASMFYTAETLHQTSCCCFGPQHW